MLSVICQTSQNFIRITNMLVTSILFRLDFCRLCKMTAGCNFHNQLLFTACCLITVSWIKANRVSSLPGLSYIAFLSTIQYQYNTLKYWDNTIQYQYNTILIRIIYNTFLLRIIQYNTIQYLYN